MNEGELLPDVVNISCHQHSYTRLSITTQMKYTLHFDIIFYMLYNLIYVANNAAIQDWALQLR